MGDMIRSIGNDKYGIKDNKEKISKGRMMIRELVKDKSYTILNNMDTAKNGPRNWIDRQDSRTKGCLDLAIASDCLLPYVTLVWVDRERKLTPRRVMRSKKKIKTIFTDHFPVKVVLSGIPRRKEETKTKPTWNLGKPGGWDKYKKLTDDAAEKIVKIIEDKHYDIDTKIQKSESIEHKIKFAAFDKNKPSSKKFADTKKCNKCRLLRCNPGAEGSSDKAKSQSESQYSRCLSWRKQEEKDEELLKRQSERLEDAINKIKASKLG